MNVVVRGIRAASAAAGEVAVRLGNVGAVTNARQACTVLSRRKVEREAVDLYLADRDDPPPMAQAKG